MLGIFGEGLGIFDTANRPDLHSAMYAQLRARQDLERQNQKKGMRDLAKAQENHRYDNAKDVTPQNKLIEVI